MDIILLLAQDAVPPVDKAIDWAERASQLGVAGIALFFMFVTCGISYWLLRRQDKKLTDASAENSRLEREFRGKTEDLLREMLERGEDGQEALGANTQAVRDMVASMQQLATRIEYIERNLPRS